jgi:hypothetical protein
MGISDSNIVILLMVHQPVVTRSKLVSQDTERMLDALIDAIYFKYRTLDCRFSSK